MGLAFPFPGYVVRFSGAITPLGSLPLRSATSMPSLGHEAAPQDVLQVMQMEDQFAGFGSAALADNIVG